MKILFQNNYNQLKRGSLLSLSAKGFFGAFKQEPIKFKTSKVLPYSQENFFKVVRDVQDYEKFIPWVNQSRIISDTASEEKASKPGKFEGEVQIGFSQLSFAYISRVSYQYPHWILSEADNSRIFEGLYSKWEIRKLGEHKCEIVYDIQMTFANPLYSSVTTHFFDYLSNNINQAFEKRCYELYYQGKNINQEEASTLSTKPVDQVNKVQIPVEQKSDISHLKQYKATNSQSSINPKLNGMPDDYWVWDYKSPENSESNFVKQATSQSDTKTKQKTYLLDSLRAMKTLGYLSSLDIALITNKIESSEFLFRELITLNETFGLEMKGVYAGHVENICREYGCFAK